MNKLTNWIKQHQVAAFFVITFAIMFGLGFSWDAVLRQNQGLLLPLAFVTACGPGLAGIIVSAIINTQPKQGSHTSYWSTFLAAWAVSIMNATGTAEIVNTTTTAGDNERLSMNL